MSTSKEVKFQDLVNIVDTFLAKSGSTAKSSDVATAWKRIETMRVKAISLTEKYLRTNYTKIVEDYSQSFDDNKHLVTRFPDKRKGRKRDTGEDFTERVNIHPFIQDIFTKLLPAMIPTLRDTFTVMYEVPTSSIEETPKKLREIPDFGIHLIELINPQSEMSFLSCLIPVECKPYSNLKDAMTQALHYLFERIRFVMEISHSHAFNFHGYCVGTDGFNVVVGFVSIVDCDILVFLQDTVALAANLFPDDGTHQNFNNLTLDQLPGLQLLIGLLTSDPERLGTKPVSGLHIPDMEIVSVLGLGSFCTAFRAIKRSLSSTEAASASAVTAQPAHVVVKTPIFIKSGTPNALTVAKAQIEIEQRLLTELSGLASSVIPRIEGYNHELGYSILSPVGKSLMAFCAECTSNKTERLGLGKRILQKCLLALNHVHELGITHRDIRPTNIVIMGSTVDTCSPVLIDWGLGGKSDVLYDFKGLNYTFQHDKIVNAHFDYNFQRAESGISLLGKRPYEETIASSISYLPEYDLSSLHLTVTAIVECLPRFEAPWRIADDENYIQIRADMVQNILNELNRLP